jgi:virginiamycin B lyase
VGRITTSGAVTEFPVSGSSSPLAITAGPDGALWFTIPSGEIGRITTSGVVTEFPRKGNYSTLAGIAAGPDGNVWFTQKEDGSTDGEQPAVGEITPSGATTIHPLPQGTTLDPNLGVDTDPTSIAAGRDGDLWFLENSAVGRITTGGVIQQVPVTIPGMTTTTLDDLATTSDGAVWFTADGDIDSNTAVGTAFGRVAASGAVKVYFLRSYTYVSDLTPGRHGSLWFVDAGNQVTRIGHITPKGSVETFAIPVPKGETNERPGAMALGPDGDLYFTGGYTGPKDEHTAGYIGRVTARGKVQILSLPAGLAPGGFTKGGASYQEEDDQTITSGPGRQL